MATILILGRVDGMIVSAEKILGVEEARQREMRYGWSSGSLRRRGIKRSPGYVRDLWCAL